MGQPGTLYLCYPSSKPHPQPHSSAHLFGINQVDQQAEGFRSLERLGQGLRAENELRSGLRQPRATQGNLKNRVFPPGRAGDQGGTDRYPPTRWVSGDKTPWVSRGGVGSPPPPHPSALADSYSWTERERKVFHEDLFLKLPATAVGWEAALQQGQRRKEGSDMEEPGARAPVGRAWGQARGQLLPWDQATSDTTQWKELCSKRWGNESRRLQRQVIWCLILCQLG